MTELAVPDPGFIDQVFDGWRPGAMYPSELWWLACEMARAGVETVIEGGRKDGRSTWTLATLLRDTPTHIYAIDLDREPDRLAEAETRLTGLGATCLTGDVHRLVPELLRRFQGRRIAVALDGPKGWEGLATLLAAALDPSVVLVAQHNLHRGHLTRTLFQKLSPAPVFMESAAPDDAVILRLRSREREEMEDRGTRRPVDHTSLGLMRLDAESRRHLEEGLEVRRRRMRPWDPLAVRAHWLEGDYGYCTRIRSRSRFTLTRFRRR